MFYDDEGYVLLSLRNFAEHGGLYDKVYTQYGPFPYVLYYGMHLLGWPFTHTAGRLLTLGAWAGTALCCAALVGQGARSLTAKLTVLAAAFVYLWVMSSEPSHPGGLIAPATAMLAALGARWIATDRVRAWGILTGAVTVALLLTKINVGGLVALAAAAWWLLHHRHDGLRRWAPAIVAVGASALPFVLMRPLLDLAWVQTYAIVFACSSVAAVGSAALGAGPRFGWKAVGWTALAGVTVALVVLGVIFVRGTTPADLLQGVILGPLRQPVNFSLRYVWPAETLAFALGSTALWATAWILRRRGMAAVDVGVAALRVLAALGVAAAIARFPLSSPDRPIFAYAMPCLWFFLWPLAGEKPAFVAARTWVGLLLLGQCLHPFPVAGSQIAWGTFLALPIATLGGWHAAGWLVRRFAPTESPAWHKKALVLRGAIAAFAVLCGWRLAQVGERYRAGSFISLPGAEALRLPTEATALYRTLILNAVAHSDMLFSEPGMFSLNLWSGLPTPTLANVTHWFSLLDAEKQQAIVRALEAHPRACVIVQREHVNFLARGGFAPAGPLHDYIAKNFAPAFALDDFEFCVRQGRRIEPLMLGDVLMRPVDPAFPAAVNTMLKLTLLLPPGGSVARIEIAAPGDATGKLILDASNARVEVTPTNMRGEPTGKTAPRTWPFALEQPASVSIYYNRVGLPRAGNTALVVLRDPTGGELALARL
ncbi:MAG: hypothetical protein ABIR80_11065, partial [Opitutaceae bacterium]